MAKFVKRPEAEAISVFGKNLKDLLLSAPAGNKAVLGLDPGIRTGVKVACVDNTGKVLETTTIYPHEPRKDWVGALATLARMAQTHQVQLVAIVRGSRIFRGTAALDAGLISSAQAVEHYEIARYGTLKAWAEKLGHAKAVTLLDATLKEESKTDDALSALAKTSINAAAQKKAA
ncbi:MAG: DUF892 family protein [Agrobacterium sp.]|nr:DUF892 family protein [Agrobacterium sp.]